MRAEISWPYILSCFVNKYKQNYNEVAVGLCFNEQWALLQVCIFLLANLNNSLHQKPLALSPSLVKIGLG